MGFVGSENDGVNSLKNKLFILQTPYSDILKRDIEGDPGGD